MFVLRGSAPVLEARSNLLDGAFLISEEGVAVSATCYLDADATRLALPLVLGGRHRAGAAVVSVTNAVAAVVSESAVVRLLDDGMLEAEIIPELWSLNRYSSHIEAPILTPSDEQVTVLSRVDGPRDGFCHSERDPLHLGQFSLSRLSRPLMSRSSKARALGLALLLAVAAVGGAAWTTVPTPARGENGTEGALPGIVPEYAENGMVVAAKKRAAEAGVSVLKKGGNAVDAAVATGFALAVVHPFAGNIGGGGFMVVRMPDGSVTTIDHREDAPSGATQDVYLDDEGNAARRRSRRGYLASGVPGTVAGLLKALHEYGTLGRGTVMAPAIQLAEEGFPLPHTLARDLNSRYDTFAEFPVTKRYFTKGRPSKKYRPGERFVQEDLAATLKRIRDRGRSAFYEGKTARLIAEQFQANGGLIDRQDLAEYEAVEREPVTMDYRGYAVHSMGPPSSGGVAIAQLLNAAEMKNIDRMGFNSSATVHYVGEAMRRVFADRAKWLGDPDHVDVPTEGLIQEDYMRERMATFDSTHITPSDSVKAGHPTLAGESMETTHYSVADSNGMAVSVTTTINSGYGSKVVVDGAGFFMNNEMNDFVLKPGVPNQFGLSGTKRNLVAPDRRMVSSMSPTIIEDPDGRLFMIIGAPGGSTIITTVFQVIMNVIDHGMDIEQAVTARRVHHQWKPRHLSYEAYALSKDALRNLETRGWDVVKGVFGGDPEWGRAQGLRVRHPDRPGQKRVFFGGSDPRSDGAAVGF